LIPDIPEDQVHQLTGLGEILFPDRYAIHPEETWKEACARWARGGAAAEHGENISKWESRFYTECVTNRFIPGGRIMRSLGRPLQATSNCFVIGPDDLDSREGWGQATKEVIIISGEGGGVGLNGSTIRPRGSAVGRTGGLATGAVSLFEILNAAAEVIRGGGGRRAALMVCLNHDHPDLEEFLNKKLDLKELKNVNASIGFMNESIEGFIEKVKNDEDYDLIWQDKIIKTIKARDVWDTIIHNSLKVAEPGVLNLYLINEMNNLYYCREITCTNPCVTGDTRVSTEQGLVQIKDLVRQPAPIYTMDNGDPRKYRTKKVIIDPRMGQSTPQKMDNCFVSGEKQVFRLKTKEGYSLKLTANHRVMTTEGWKQTDELHLGDKIHIQNTVGGFGSKGHWNLGIIAGWLTGDGCLVGCHKDVPHLDFYPPDKDVFPILLKAVENTLGKSPAWYLPTNEEDWKRSRKAHIQSAALREHLGELCQQKFRIPEFIWQGTRGTQQGYISALFSADGSVQGTKTKGFSVRLASSRLKLLEDVQRLLLNFNIFSTIYPERRPEGWRKLPDGHGEYKSYWCRADHELVISRGSMVTFKDEIKLIREDKQQLLEKNISTYTKGPYSESFTAEFIELEALGVEIVFDLSEPVTHSFCANGLVVHNCGELPLSPYSACNLSNLVLPRFVNRNGTDLQWGKLNTTITTTIRFLDNMIDVGHYPFEEIQKEMTNTRRLGMGVTGLHTMLLQLGMKYDSEEAYAFVAKMMRFIKNKAYEASIFLAVEKGQFPLLDREQFIKSGFCKTLKPSIRDKILEYGIRNCAVMTVPPHGTGALICNVTSGIEVMFAPACTRTYQDGEETKTTIVFDPMAEMLMQEGNDSSLLQGALDVPPENHMKMQVIIQEHVDNAISKCLAKGTLIPTSQGLIPIEKLGEANQPNTFGKPIDNLFVIGEDNKTHRVTNHYCAGVKSGKKVRLTNGTYLSGADTHFIMTLNTNGEREWKRLQHLKQGDLVECKRNLSITPQGNQALSPRPTLRTNAKRFSVPKYMNEKLALLLGMLAADGCTFNGPNGGQTILSEKNEVVGKLYDSLFLELFGSLPRVILDKRTGVRGHVYSSSALSRWLHPMIGQGAANKKVPETILKGSQGEIENFIKGTTLDGYKHQNKLVIYDGYSFQLANGIACMLSSLGYIPRQGEKLVTGGTQDRTYYVQIDSFNSIEQHKIATARTRELVRIPEEVYNLNLHTNHPSYSSLRSLKQRMPLVCYDQTLDNLDIPYDPHTCYVKIKSIEDIKSEMYDITVAENHSYIVNNIVCHNTIWLPKGYTEKQLSDLFMKYLPQVKGVTVYTTGSRPNEPLTPIPFEEALQMGCTGGACEI